MELMTNAIQLLKAVRSTMDTIAVLGVENQDKFVGCANAVQTVVQTLEKIQQETQTKKPPTLTDVNGTPPNEGTENINVQEVVNGR